jgi:hypothetical protein
MKKKFIFLFFLIEVCFYSIKTEAQSQVQIDLEILQDISQLDLTAFINFGKGNFDAVSIPLVLQITMDYPSNDEVVLSGNVFWNSPDGNKNGQIIGFESHPFKDVKVVTNQEFNKKIIFLAPQINNDLMDENVKRGKPSGKYTVNLSLRDVNNGEVATTSEVIEITNPTQTFFIQSPQMLSQNDIGGVTAIWDAVEGAKYYKVLANVRSSKKQSLEEALNSANPLIDNKNVGLVTSVNLAEILNRQWLPGQEVVLRVAAVVPATNGEKEINSANIVDFYLTSSNSDEEQQLTHNFGDLMNNVINDLRENFDQNDENMNLQNVTGTQLLNMIESGQLNFSNIVITDEEGRIVTYDELNNLLNYLRANPGALINFSYQSN